MSVSKVNKDNSKTYFAVFSFYLYFYLSNKAILSIYAYPKCYFHTQSTEKNQKSISGLDLNYAL